MHEFHRNVLNLIRSRLRTLELNESLLIVQMSVDIYRFLMYQNCVISQKTYNINSSISPLKSVSHLLPGLLTFFGILDYCEGRGPDQQNINLLCLKDKGSTLSAFMNMVNYPGLFRYMTWILIGLRYVCLFTARN